MDYLVYAGVTAKRAHPTHPAKIKVEEAKFCSTADLKSVQDDLGGRHVVSVTIRLDDPVALAQMVHPGVVAF